MRSRRPNCAHHGVLNFFWTPRGLREDAAIWCDRPLTSSSRTSNTWTGCSRVIPDARQPDESRSLSAGHMAKRTEIGNSVHDAKKDRLLSAVRMATAAFLRKNTNSTMHILGLWKSNDNEEEAIFSKLLRVRRSIGNAKSVSQRCVWQPKQLRSEDQFTRENASAP